jgi:hypothetical protein
METEIQPPRASIAHALVVAMLQGLLLWWLAHTQDMGAWPGSSAAWYAALLSFGIVMAPLIYGLAPWNTGTRAWAITGLIAALLLASSWQFGAHFLAPGAREALMSRPPTPLLPLQILILFHAVPFIQIYLQQGHWRCAYSLLFSRTWQNALQLALAALFTLVLWLLLVLWALLFRMIGLPFASTLLFDVPGYALIVIALGFGIGFQLVGSAERLLIALRQQVLGLLKWLVPVAALILVVFSCALLMRTPALLAEHHHVIRAVWLLWLVVVSIYLLNAAYQDGSAIAPYPALLGRLVRWSVPLLVVLSAMAVYEIWIRIAAYGLTSSRLWAMIVAAITLAYAVSYALAARRAEPWMAPMSRANVGMALLVIASLSLTLTPMFYPDRLAARSQAARLAKAAGSAGPADFMTLRFDFGDYGYSELGDLATDARTPAGIRTGAGLALRVSSWRERDEFSYTTVALSNIVLEAIPAGTPIDTDLRQKIQALVPARFASALQTELDSPAELATYRKAFPDKLFYFSCASADPCPVVFIDLNGDQKPEAVAIVAAMAHIYEQRAGRWQEVASAYPSKRGTKPAARLLEQLRAGNYGAIERQWKQLKFGEDLWHMIGPD